MNNDSQMPIGDFPTDQNELTVPTEEMVTRRAREIALIDERNPQEYTDDDWEQARRELTDSETDPAAIESLSDRDSILGETGSRAPQLPLKDEALLDARLVSRGVEEAAHDQMVAAAEEDQTQEG